MPRKSKAASLIVIQWESQGVAEVVVQYLRLLEGGGEEVGIGIEQLMAA